MTFGLSAGTIAAGVSAAASAAAAANSFMGGSGGGGGGGQPSTQTVVNQLPRHMQPYEKAYLERQLNISNQDYNPYPGLFQMLAQAQQQETAAANARPWDTFGMPAQPMDGQGSGPAFANKAVRPFNPLTARPGEKLPIPIEGKEYQRYLAAVQNDPMFSPNIMDQSQYKEWQKNNKGLAKNMANRPYMLGNQPYQQHMLAQNQNAQPQPNVLDQYLAARNFRGLLGV